MAVQPSQVTDLKPLDEFAIAALPLLVQKYEKVNISVDDIAKRAYIYADAMLNECARRRPSQTQQT